MKFYLQLKCLILVVSLFLLSCGGGSTVTAVSLTAADNNVPVGGRTEVTARADDSVAGNTLGEKVTFSIRHNESGSYLDVVTDRLDANGSAKAIFHAGPRQGVDIVEASFASGARTTTTIRIGDGVVIGDIQLQAFSLGATDEASSGWRIRATVTDTRGFPAPGITVNFSTNNGTLSPNTVTTDNAGIAEALLVNLAAGQGARVWASAGGISVSTIVGPRS